MCLSDWMTPMRHKIGNDNPKYRVRVEIERGDCSPREIGNVHWRRKIRSTTKELLCESYWGSSLYSDTW